MAYPPAPWILQGHVYQTLHLVDSARARPLVPREMEICSLWPDKTLGGVYLASYGSGSVLEYHELFVAAALVRYAGKLGFFCSHVYVDSAVAVMAASEIWGLPAQMAQFTWEKSKQGRTTVRYEERLLCTLELNWQFPLWQQSLALPSFSASGTNLLLFEGQAELRLGLVGARLDVPVDSPLATLNLGQPWLTISGESLRLVAGEPDVVGTRTTVQ